MKCTFPLASVAFFVAMIFIAGCEGWGGTGPEDPGTLNIYVDPAEVASLSQLSLDVVRVQLVISSTPSGLDEEVLDLNVVPQPVNLIGIQSETPELAFALQVPRDGYVSQIRFIHDDAQVTVGSEVFPVKVPSGPQTGEKMIAGNITVEIRDACTTSVTVRLDLEHSMLRNQGQGYILKPVIKLLGGAVSSFPFDTWVPDQLCTVFRESASEQEIKDQITSIQATILSSSAYSPTYLLQLPKGSDVKAIAAIVRQNGKVLTAGPNYLGRFNSMPNEWPNDPLYQAGHQWPLTNDAIAPMSVVGVDIEAHLAWEFSVGANVTVAVIDTGIDIQHPELRDQLWVNNEERSGKPNFDDDFNKLYDDIYGWDWGDDDSDPDDNLSRLLGGGHGSLVAGIIGASSHNGIGIAGVAWGARLMPLKIASTKYGANKLSRHDFFAALEYAREQNAHIANASLSIYVPAAAVDDLRAELDLKIGQLLLVVSSGNNSKNLEKWETKVFPACIVHPHIITVAAHTAADKRYTGSNYGPAFVHLFAPGWRVYSTMAGGGYLYWDGKTSAAAAHVSGVAALLKSANPVWDADRLKNAILNGTIGPMPEYEGWVSTGGRLNAFVPLW